MNMVVDTRLLQLLVERLKWCRRVKNKTLREVEKATGITNAHLSQLENGDVKNPGIFTLKALADYYGVSIDDLIEEASPPRQRSRPESKCKHDILYAAQKSEKEGGG